MDKFNFNTDFETEACEVANPKDSMERLTEEARFEVVCKELDKGVKKPGLWLKAKTEARGDINTAEAIYAGLRVQSLKDEEDMLRAGSEAKIARIQADKERVNLAKEAEATRAAEALRLSEKERVERELVREANARVAKACGNIAWHGVVVFNRPDKAMWFLQECGYSVEVNFMSYSLNGVKVKGRVLANFAKDVRRKKEYIPFDR
jgi:hypothetical protein